MNKQEFLDLLKERFSEHTRTNYEISSTSALSDFMAFLAEFFAYVYDLAEQEITLDIRNITADNVHKVIGLTGFENINGTRSTVECTITNDRTDVNIIPPGSLFSSGDTDSTYVQWTNIEAIAIDPDDSVDVVLYSVDKGSFSIEIGAVNNVVSNLDGITVESTAVSVPGLDPIRDENLVAYILSEINNSVFGNAFHMIDAMKKASGLTHIKMFTNNRTTARTIGTQSLDPGEVMVVIYPSTVSDDAFLAMASAFLKLMPPALRMKLPVDDSEGRYAYYDAPEGISVDFGVFYAEQVTFDIAVEVLTYEKKPNGAFYTLEDVMPGIKAQITNYIETVTKDAPLGSTYYNARMQAAAVRVPGCADCYVEVSVNEAVATSSNIVLTAIQYPSITSLEVT